MKKPIRINTYNFECCVLQEKLPVILVFGAIWESKSAALFEEMEYLIKEHDGEFVFGKVECDYNQIIYHDYQIGDIPCMVIFENGKIIKKVIGKDFKTTKSVKSLIDWYYGIYPYY